MKILRMLRRLKTLGEFDKLVPPELIAKLEESGEFKGQEIRTKHFQFVLVHVEEGKPDEIPVIISKIMGTFLHHGAMLSGIESSLVVGYLGVPFPQNDTAEARMSLVTALLAENGNLVRVAHGQCDGMVGNLGAEGVWRYGGIIPGFSGVLKKLFDSQFGTALEVSAENRGSPK